MLSFKALSERKTKVKINPKQAEITEKDNCNHSKMGMKCPAHGMKPCPDTEMTEGKKTGSCGKPADECMCDKKEKTPAQKSVEGKGGDMSEAKKKDDSYLEVDPKKRQKNNEKARKEMDKVPSQKNPHFESTGDQAYGSQEEVSEESTEEVAETETLLTFKQFEEAEKRIKAKADKKMKVYGGPAYIKKPDVKKEEVEKLDEISQKTATKAFARRATDEFESDSENPRDFTKSGKSKADAAKSRIEKKFGKKAGKHAERAAHATTFGRKSFSMPKVDEEVVNEEGADSLKDRRMERGGVGGNQRYSKPISNTPNTFGKKKPKYDGMSAVEKVKAKIEKQYGKGAIMDTKKKK